MSNYPKYLLSSLVAASGDITIPPASASEAGEGRLSLEKGWGDINSTPLEDGGIAPFRDDFNGVLYLLSQFALWQQQGGLMNYSSSLAYEAGNEVLMNGVKYRALADNGGANEAVVPGSNPKVWKNMDSNVPAGAVVPFANVKLGGSDGRRPIFWGSQDADEGWVLCDGGKGVGDTTVPNLINKFVRGSSADNAGTTGGADTVSLGSNNVPAHTHTVTINSAGAHTHTRGTMNITGDIDMVRQGGTGRTNSAGALFYNGNFDVQVRSGANDDWGSSIGLDASRAWTGATSSNGAHTHTATCSSTGSGEAFSILPAYYQLAYFVKLPEV